MDDYEFEDPKLAAMSLKEQGVWLNQRLAEHRKELGMPDLVDEYLDGVPEQTAWDISQAPRRAQQARELAAWKLEYPELAKGIMPHVAPEGETVRERDIREAKLWKAKRDKDL